MEASLSPDFLDLQKEIKSDEQSPLIYLPLYTEMTML